MVVIMSAIWNFFRVSDVFTFSIVNSEINTLDAI